MIRGWRSVAQMHGNGYLMELFEFAFGELLERVAKAERRSAQLERADQESDPNEQTRLRMAQRRDE